MANPTSNYSEGENDRFGLGSTRGLSSGSRSFGPVEAYVKRSIIEKLREAIGSGINAAFSSFNSGNKHVGFSDGANRDLNSVSGRLEEGNRGGGAGIRAADAAYRYGTGLMAVAYNMLPNVTDAVSQRMVTQSVSSMLGGRISAQDLIAGSNNLIGGGATGALSGQLAMGSLAGAGILPTTAGYQNIMGQVGGLSVLTGMGNEQVAAGFAGINGMNFLRGGINARDAKGNLRSPADIANDLYKRMVPAGRRLTEQQAAQVFNPHSKGYADIAMVSGGDPNLMATLQQMIYYQAVNGGKKLDVSSAEGVMTNILRLPGDDPSRNQFKYNTSEANKLESVGTGLVAGYGNALSATAAVNNGFASLAQSMPTVANGFARLAGIIDTLPFAGNTGMTMFGLGSNAAGMANAKISDFLMDKALGRIAAETGLDGGSAGGGAGGGAIVAGGGGRTRSPGARGARARGAARAAGRVLGRVVPVAAAAYEGYQGYQDAKQHHWDWGGFTSAAVSGGTIGAAIGSPVFGVGAGVGAAVGAIAGGLSYAGGYLLGGGWGGDTTASSGKTGTFTPADGPVTADFGQKPKNNSYWQMLGYHSGRDFGARKGSSARAYKSGTVVRAGRNVAGEAYGNVVEIDHGTHRSLYAHLDSIKVRKGQAVQGGSEIGKVGETGSGAHGPHLHFEVRQGGGGGGKSIRDPRPFLTGAIAGAIDKVGDVFKKAEELISGPENKTAAGTMDYLPQSVTADNRGAHSNVISTSSLLGFGGDAGPAMGKGSGINITMNVNISGPSTYEAERIARDVKAALEKELRYSRVSEY